MNDPTARLTRTTVFIHRNELETLGRIDIKKYLNQVLAPYIRDGWYIVVKNIKEDPDIYRLILSRFVPGGYDKNQNPFFA